MKTYKGIVYGITETQRSGMDKLHNIFCLICQGISKGNFRMSKFLGSDTVMGYPELSYDNSNFNSFDDLIKKAYKEGSLKIRCHRLTALWLEYASNLRYEEDDGPDYVECNLSIVDAELIQKMGEEVFGRWVKKD